MSRRTGMKCANPSTVQMPSFGPGASRDREEEEADATTFA